MPFRTQSNTKGYGSCTGWALTFPKQRWTFIVQIRNQLLELVNQENNRLKQSWDDDARQSIRDVLEYLKTQLKSIDSQLARMLQADTRNQRTIEILESVKGVGPVMISTVIAELPGTRQTQSRRGCQVGWRGTHQSRFGEEIW